MNRQLMGPRTVSRGVHGEAATWRDRPTDGTPYRVQRSAQRGRNWRETPTDGTPYGVQGSARRGCNLEGQAN